MSPLGKKIGLTVFLTSPVLVTALLVWIIAQSLQNPAIHKLPPVGVGAGDTGGANAIGDAIQRREEAIPSVAVANHVQPPPPATGQGKLVDPTKLGQGFILIVRDVSGRATPSSPIYMAGTCNGWNPAHPQWKLEPQSDMRWRIHVPRQSGGLEFKFTRGSWALEELREDMSVPSNRTIAPIDISGLAAGEVPKIELDVPHWGDERKDNAALREKDPYRSITAEGGLRRLQVQGGAGTARGKLRELLVWLPPGYDDAKNAQVRYPVLYLHDGQNIFEKHSAVPEEWKADETATRLIQEGKVRPLIIVGIPHGGPGRITEYLPVAALDNVTPEGDAHVRWLLAEVLPRVEAAFRVARGPENTGVGGSSLGAAISVLAASRHPDVFGLLLVESLPLNAGKPQAWQVFVDSVSPWPKRTFLGMGGKEHGADADRSQRNQELVDAVKALDARIKAGGASVSMVIDPEAVHNEGAWAQRLPRALEYLFPASAPASR